MRLERPAGRDKREIINNFSLNYAQSASGGHLKSSNWSERRSCHAQQRALASACGAEQGSALFAGCGAVCSPVHLCPQHRAGAGGLSGSTGACCADPAASGAAGGGEPGSRTVCGKRGGGCIRTFSGAGGRRPGADRGGAVFCGLAAGRSPPCRCRRGDRAAVRAGQRRKVHPLRCGQHQE